MMKIIEKISKYPVSVLYIIIIWVLCFMDVPETPLNNVTLMDKWVHIAMYLGTCLTIWFEYARCHRAMRPQWLRLAVWAWLAPALMSGVIELGQAYCTGGRRSGDWYDFIANTIGCTLAAVIGAIVLKMRRQP